MVHRWNGKEAYTGPAARARRRPSRVLAFRDGVPHFVPTFGLGLSVANVLLLKKSMPAKNAASSAPRRVHRQPRPQRAPHGGSRGEREAHPRIDVAEPVMLRERLSRSGEASRGGTFRARTPAAEARRAREERSDDGTAADAEQAGGEAGDDADGGEFRRPQTSRRRRVFRASATGRGRGRGRSVFIFGSVSVVVRLGRRFARAFSGHEHGGFDGHEGRRTEQKVREESSELVAVHARGEPRADRAESMADAPSIAAAVWSTHPPWEKLYVDTAAVLSTAMSEVPVTILCGMGTAVVMAGTMGTPPPTPTTEPKSPATRPSGPDIFTARSRCAGVCTRRPRARSVARAARTAPSARSSSARRGSSTRGGRRKDVVGVPSAGRRRARTPTPQPRDASAAVRLATSRRNDIALDRAAPSGRPRRWSPPSQHPVGSRRDDAGSRWRGFWKRISDDLASAPFPVVHITTLVRHVYSTSAHRPLDRRLEIILVRVSAHPLRGVRPLVHRGESRLVLEERRVDEGARQKSRRGPRTETRARQSPNTPCTSETRARRTGSADTPPRVL